MINATSLILLLFEHEDTGYLYGVLPGCDTDGQTERTIQKFEDMLRACVIDFNRS